MTNPQIQEKINQIQLIQQNLQSFAMQRQQFQVQETEIESALKEIEKTNQTYRIIGNIMVFVEKADLKKDLMDKKEMLTLRINSIEKQELRMKEKAEEIQKDVLLELENKQKPAKSKKEQI